MTPEEAIEILSTLTYKPGWRISAYATPNAVILRAGRDEPDTEAHFAGRPTRIIPVVLTESFHHDKLRDMPRETLLEAAFDVFVRREVHEVEEWLRIDGKPLKSPHPGRIVGILGNGCSTPT